VKIEHFEDIEAWQLPPVYRRTGRRELARKVYRLTKRPGFAKDHGPKKQIQDAAVRGFTHLPCET